MARPKMLTITYMVLFSQRTVQLPACVTRQLQVIVRLPTKILTTRCAMFRCKELRTNDRSTIHRTSHAKLELTHKCVGDAPSVELSQKHELDVCSPAPFFCKMVAVTAIEHDEHERNI